MPYRFRIRTDDNFVLVRFEGAISPEEEGRAVHEVLGDPRLEPRPRVLVDKRDATMEVGPEHVAPTIDMVRGMLELRAEGGLEHEFLVTLDWDEACRWLGVDPAGLLEGEPR